MKKLFAILLSLSLILLSVPAFAETEGDSAPDVEIFLVPGSNTIFINGEPVTVTAPFVTDDGCTLVPLRVISEAFGAEVDYSADTGEVYIEYPAVSIILTIGSVEASVNFRTETLAAAPVLLDGVTEKPTEVFVDYTNEEQGFSYNIPTYVEESGSSDLNYSYLSYITPEKSISIKTSFYSKTPTDTAASLSAYNHRIDSLLNKNFVTVGAISDNLYEELGEHVGYVSTVKLGDYQLRAVSIYIEKGNYIYNIAAGCDSSSTETLDKIISSFKCSELDPDSVGQVLFNRYEFDKKYTTKLSKIASLTVPMTRINSDLYSEFYDNKMNNAELYISKGNAPLSEFGGLRSSALDSYKDLKYNTTTEITIPLERKTLGFNDFYIYGYAIDNSYKAPEEDDLIGDYDTGLTAVSSALPQKEYYITALTSHLDRAYSFTFSVNELYYTDSFVEEVMDILSTLTFTK